jgi:drug/metabolite transporter (DMT)-like permease
VRSFAILAIVLANLLGGLTYVGQDLALKGLPFATITLGRNLVAMVFMAIWLVSTKGITWRYPRADFIRLLVIGVVAYAMPLLLGTIGTQWSTAANGSILILFEPCAILIFARLLLGEHVRRMQAVGIAVGMVGAFFIVLKDAPVDGLLEGQHLRGNLVLALHAVLWGLYSPVMKPIAGRYGAVDVTFMTMVLAQLVLIPAALFEVDQWQAGPELMPALGWTVGLGLFGSFAATVLWTASLKHLKASAVAIFVFLQPLAGVGGDAIASGRAITPEAMIGGAFIAVGVLLVVLRPRQREAS